MKLLKISDRNLFLNTVKRQGPMLMLFAILLILAVPVLSMLCFRAGINYTYTDFANYYEYMNQVENSISEMAYSVGVSAVVLSAVMGVFAGCAVVRHLMNRQSAVLFGSLPVRREKQLAVIAGSGALCYLISVAITALLAFIVYAVNGYLKFSAPLFSLLLTGILWFFLFYALTLLMGMICGMTSMQLVLSLTAVFYLPATAYILSFILETFYPNTYIGYYITPQLLGILSPAFRMIDALGTEEIFEDMIRSGGYLLPARDVIAYTLAVVVLFALSLLIYRRRNNALSGQPIVFSKVASVVKYALMFPVTALCSYLFYEIGEYGWMVFGLLLGAVLSFMLLNVVLSKNVHAFFQNIKGLGIFCAAFALFFLLILSDPFSVDLYVPESEKVEWVMADPTGCDIKFTSEQSIAAAGRIVRYSQEEIENTNDLWYLVDCPYYGGRRLNMQVVFKLKNGFQIAKNVYVSGNSQVQEDYTLLYSSSELADTYFNVLKENGEIYGSALVFSEKGYSYQPFELSLPDIEQFISLYEKACGGQIFSDKRGPAFLSFSIRGYEYPIYLDEAYRECAEFLCEHNIYTVDGILPSMENIDQFLSGINRVVVFDDEGVESQTYTDRDTIRKLYLASCGLDIYPYYTLPFTGGCAEFYSGSDDACFSTYIYGEQ